MIPSPDLLTYPRALAASLLLLLSGVMGASAAPIQATDLARELEASSPPSSLRYQNKSITVTGVVDTIKVSGNTGSRLALLKAPPKDNVMVRFAASATTATAAVQSGQTITVQGLCRVLDGGVAIVESVLVPTAPEGMPPGDTPLRAATAMIKTSGGNEAANSEILAIVRMLPGTTLEDGQRKLRPDRTALMAIFRDPAEAERYDQYLAGKLAKEDTGSRPFPQTPAIEGVVATPIDLSPDSAAKFRDGVTLYKVQITGPNITLAGFLKVNGRWYWLPK